MKRSPARLDEEALYQKALRALAHHGRTEVELRHLLRGGSRAAVEKALERLRDHGYLNDARLAESFSAWKRESEKQGRLRALRDLRRRGVERTVAEAAVGAAYAGASEEELLRGFLEKKRIASPRTPREAANLYRKLLMAGFTPAAARDGLRRLRSEPEWVEALEGVEPEAEEG